MESINLAQIDFEWLKPYIDDMNITDINFNGQSLWIDDLTKGRYLDLANSDISFFDNLCYKIANSVNANFNQVHPLVEAELDELRISIIHSSIAKSGHTLSIRKTPKYQRLERSKMLLDKYVERNVLDFLVKCVKANCNIMVCGLPGAGKTELVKYLMSFINDTQRVITIEDTLELRYHNIYPERDCVALRVNDKFSYVDAIKASLRQKPNWMLVSEIRSKEVAYLIESATTGTHLMSTIHAMDASKIPLRMLHMFEKDVITNQNILTNIYDVLDIGIRVELIIKDKTIKRMITQVVYYEVIDNECKSIILYEKGKQSFDLNLALKLKERLKKV